MVIVFMFFLGAVIGSFLNVCILRIPEGLSIVLPASHCPKCKKEIHWYDNVPVFAWLWLKGKCRACGEPISPMYPLVELATALLFVACYLEFGITRVAVKWLVFTCLILVLTITDLRVRMLPDVVNWPGFAAGLVFSAVVPPNDGAAAWISASLFHRVPSYRLAGVLDALLAATLGSLGFWALGLILSRMLGRPAFGLGDVKMLAMLGAFLGVGRLFFTVLVGSFIGTIVGLGVVAGLYFSGWKRGVAERANRRGIGKLNQLRWKLAKRYQLPMGTYLGIGALIVVYLGPIALQHLTSIWLP